MDRAARQRVLALRDDLQTRPLSARELAQLKRKATRAPRALERPIYALWGRGGVDHGILDDHTLGFSPKDMLAR